ncbi:hypothetical protein HDU97_000768 [Phlyctochytrium planicorne]|nr:hypothetical protein HDU97_000768 [Phlyctochytrium planicorne]
MDRVPDEIVEHILTFVRLPSSLFSCLQASKRLNIIGQRLMSDVTFESVEQRLRFSRKVALESSAKPVKKESEPYVFNTANTVTKLNFGLKPSKVELDESDYGGKWEDRLVNDLLLDISKNCRNIKFLDLSGCQVAESIFEEAITNLKNLEGINISQSSLKGGALEAIRVQCFPRIKFLDISGIMRFRRIHSDYLMDLLQDCTSLTTLVACNCPDLEDELMQELKLRFPFLSIIIQ